MTTPDIIIAIALGFALLLALAGKPGGQASAGAWWAWALLVAIFVLAFAASVGLVQDVLRARVVR